MSGDWAWDQCVSELYKECWCLLILPQKDLISVDIDTHGAIFIPVILGSNKTTVSVATGQHEYHPVYLSIGNVHNHIRRAHKDALVLIGFLPIPKGEFVNAPQGLQSHKYSGARKDTNNETFRDFHRRLLHGCFTVTLETLEPFMHKWDVVQCSDHHFRRAIYGLGAFIADYPEQTAVSGTVYNWCVTSALCVI